MVDVGQTTQGEPLNNIRGGLRVIILDRDRCDERGLWNVERRWQQLENAGREKGSAGST
jgi:hypothetical protein